MSEIKDKDFFLTNCIKTVIKYKNAETLCKLGININSPFINRNLIFKKVKSVKKIFVPHKVQSDNCETQVLLYNSKINDNFETNISLSKNSYLFSKNFEKNQKKFNENKIRFKEFDSKHYPIYNFKKSAIVYMTPILSNEMRKRNKSCLKVKSINNFQNNGIYYKTTLKRDLIPKLALLPKIIVEHGELNKPKTAQSQIIHEIIVKEQ